MIVVCDATDFSLRTAPRSSSPPLQGKGRGQLSVRYVLPRACGIAAPSLQCNPALTRLSTVCPGRGEGRGRPMMDIDSLISEYT